MHASLLRRLTLPAAAGALFAGALTLPPTSADACSPPLPGLESTLPEDGGEWPGNAAVVIKGYDLTFDNLTVSVDGSPAAFVVADGRLGTAARIEPAPASGAAVVITGSPCFDWAEDDVCPAIEWRFTAGAHDLEPPAAPVGLQIDLLDHFDVPSEPGLCEQGADYTYFVTVELAEGIATDRMVLEAEVDGGWRRVGGVDVRQGGAPILRVPATGPAPDAPPCLRARVLDHTEQWSDPTATVCALCRAQVDDTPLEFSPPYDPPMWSADDRVPDGQCFDDEPGPEPEPEPEPEPNVDGGMGGDAGPSADAGEAEVDSGGDGCRAAPGQGGEAPLGFWLMLGLGGLIGRRITAGGPSRR